MPFLCTGNRKHRGVLVHMCTISCRAYCARAHSMRMFECRTIRMCTSKRAPTALRIFCFGKLKREPKGLIFNTYRLSVTTNLKFQISCFFVPHEAFLRLTNGNFHSSPTRCKTLTTKKKKDNQRQLQVVTNYEPSHYSSYLTLLYCNHEQFIFKQKTTKR